MLLALLLLLTMLALEPSAAHRGERLYVIPEITEEMLSGLDLRDGSIHDWEDLVGEPVLTLIDFVNAPLPPTFEARQLDLSRSGLPHLAGLERKDQPHIRRGHHERRCLCQ